MVSGLLSGTRALFRLGFPTAPPVGLTCSEQQLADSLCKRYAVAFAPTVRRRTVSGSFHPPFGVLFTFPSRYSFTIGHQVVLSLGRWSSQIPTGLLVPHGTQVPVRTSRRFVYGGVTLYARPSQVLPLHRHHPRQHCSADRLVLQPLSSNACRLTLERFGLIPVRSPLLRESRLISFPPGTEMVQFPGFAQLRMGMTPCRFPYSEIPVSSLACQLDGAYRRLLRPSSPPDAKASTMRP